MTYNTIRRYKNYEKMDFIKNYWKNINSKSKNRHKTYYKIEESNLSFDLKQIKIKELTKLVEEDIKEFRKIYLSRYTSKSVTLVKLTNFLSLIEKLLLKNKLNDAITCMILTSSKKI